MNFGWALEQINHGNFVTREGWNGKGMYLFAAKVSAFIIEASTLEEVQAAHMRLEPFAQADLLPCIVMRTAQGELVFGWLASQTDMLADDWTVFADGVDERRGRR